MSFSFLFSKCVSGGADFSEFCSCVYGVVFHPKENILASCSADKSIKLWNLDTGTELSTTVDSGLGGVRSVAFSPKGDMIAAGCCNGIIYLVDMLTAKVKRLMIGHHGQDGCICDCDENSDLSTHINPECLVSWHPNWVPAERSFRLGEGCFVEPLREEAGLWGR